MGSGKAPEKFTNRLKAPKLTSSAVNATFGAVIVQIMIVDMVFLLDSTSTAVGMVDELGVMIAAVAFSSGGRDAQHLDAQALCQAGAVA